jgi:hypothetical protein
MIRHDLKLDDLAFSLGANLSNDFLEPVGHVIDQNRASILRTPNDMVLARIDYIVVGFIITISHTRHYIMNNRIMSSIINRWRRTSWPAASVLSHPIAKARGYPPV